MVSKDVLRRKFSEDYKKHYEVELFRREGFVRKKCKICGRYFWTLDPEREVCGEPPCGIYEFIGNPPTKRKFDYIEMWRFFADFFKKKGHTEIKRYPVVARWRDDLYFTIASISDFQPFVVRGEVEPPANPLIVPQVCLRFGDIPNVGITGRHFTSFIMGGQHAFNSRDKFVYWKDECLEMNFEFLTKYLGIPKEEIVAKEDVWAGGGNFGPSIEYFTRGLEIVNQVFMQFEETLEGPKELSTKVIDVGWGHNRLVWISRGDPTAYDGVFGPVIRRMVKESGVEMDEELIEKYAKLSALLNFDEVSNMEEMWRKVSERVGVSVRYLKENVLPLSALYSIADHTRTLLFAITDGAIPSNVGGGYNLRVILRRALSFIERYSIPFDVEDVAYWHIDYLKDLFPEVEDSYDEFLKVIGVEKKRFKRTLSKARAIATKLLKDERIKDRTYFSKKLAELYDTHGITPEIVQSLAKEKKVEVEIPLDWYKEIMERHKGVGKTKVEKGKFEIDAELLEGLPKTRTLYYDDSYLKEFDAKVLKVIDKRYVVLDKTCFYPEGGGQPSDTGYIEDSRVVDVQKLGGVIIHVVDGFEGKEGDMVHCRIDWKRRIALMRNHTSTHILICASRNVLGRHVWQWGSQLNEEVSRLDITHYEPLSDDAIFEIERLANRIVMENREVRTFFMSRREAEDKYGFRLYQGGAIPGKELRIVEIDGWEVEACGGTHVRRTGDIGLIRIVRTKRIQDGVVRIEFASGEGAIEHIEREKKILRDVAETLKVDVEKAPETAKKFFEEWKKQRKMIKRLRELLSDFYLEDLKRRRVDIGGCHVYSSFIEGLDDRSLIEMGKRAVERSQRTLVLILTREGESYRYLVSSSQDLISRLTELKSVSKEFITGGLGKVSENVYIGGGRLKVSEEDFLRDFPRAIVESLPVG
ncbi:MAG: alanine--tRNA ligase [Candidatus Asgardarchaeia archaeon]